MAVKTTEQKFSYKLTEVLDALASAGFDVPDARVVGAIFASEEQIHTESKVITFECRAESVSARRR